MKTSVYSLPLEHSLFIQWHICTEDKECNNKECFYTVYGIQWGMIAKEKKKKKHKATEIKQAIT